MLYVSSIEAVSSVKYLVREERTCKIKAVKYGYMCVQKYSCERRVYFTVLCKA